MLLSGLIFISVILTYAMFTTRERMLGYPCALFWAITGAQAYTLSAGPWLDAYFFTFIACVLGMTIFSVLAMYGLREKRDSIGDVEVSRGEPKLLEASDRSAENLKAADSGFLEPGSDGEIATSDRSRAIRARADRRRKGVRKPRTNYGEFK
ncbi:MAG: hypothetical protein PHV11_10120 [Candidatus Bipolaricaulis sp.]|nr:hypothetical protein [Candidatus Bipolaricaulis sp.]